MEKPLKYNIFVRNTFIEPADVAKNRENYFNSQL